MQAPMPVHAVQSASQVPQVASLVGPQAAVWYWPAPHAVQVLHAVLVDPPQAAARNCPAAQVEQAAQVVSCVGEHADVWYCPGPQLPHATHAPPDR
jgi:hypothetical protein